MGKLLRCCSVIDAVTRVVGRWVAWLILVMVLLAVSTATGRKLGIGSNGWLELQWYLFSAVFLLGAAYTLQQDKHVRVDVIAKYWSISARAVIDIVGHTLFLLPLTLGLAILGWHDFSHAWHSGEMSADAGGLIRWPVKLLIPLGFTLLALQVFSEIAKRIYELTQRQGTAL